MPVNQPQQANSKKLAWHVTYDVWVADEKHPHYEEREFFLFAPDNIEAKRLAVLYCRDNNGQPIDYEYLKVERFEK